LKLFATKKSKTDYSQNPVKTLREGRWKFKNVKTGLQSRDIELIINSLRAIIGPFVNRFRSFTKMVYYKRIIYGYLFDHVHWFNINYNVL
jgi:hypothetical protein